MQATEISEGPGDDNISPEISFNHEAPDELGDNEGLQVNSLHLGLY